MYLKMLATAALVFPAVPMVHTPIVVPNNAPVRWLCRTRVISEVPDCTYAEEDCITGFETLVAAVCGLDVPGCPCDAPLATVAMPDVDGRPAAVRAAARPDYKGIPVPANCFMGYRPEPFPVTADYEVVFDDAARVAGKPYRLLSIRRKATGQRFDIGFEMVGVDPANVRKFRPGVVRAVYGNDMQAWVRLPDGLTVFHLVSVGASSVHGELDDPLVPVPDDSVPPHDSARSENS